MELLLKRTYHTKGTNGQLFVNEQPFCYTIELPWKDNKSRVSCIPENTYNLVKRHSEKFRNHLLVENVPNRSLILIHPANNALLDLQGCIAPVSILTAPGCGLGSRIVFNPLLQLVYQQLAKQQPVTLTIVEKH